MGVLIGFAGGVIFAVGLVALVEYFDHRRERRVRRFREYLRLKAKEDGDGPSTVNYGDALDYVNAG